VSDLTIERNRRRIPRPAHRVVEPDELRDQLIERRRDLIAAMRRDGLQPGYLTQIAGVAAALDALDEEAGA
jgi:hypothetical protein